MIFLVSALLWCAVAYWVVLLLLGGWAFLVNRVTF